MGRVFLSVMSILTVYLSSVFAKWAVTGVIVGVVIASMWYLYFKIMSRIRRKKVEEDIEPKFVVSSHPETGHDPSLPEHLSQLVTVVKTKHIARELDKIRREYAESGNELYPPEYAYDENEDDRSFEEWLDDRLPIKGKPFQEGRNVNESWSEYEERLILELSAIRAEWHQKLRDLDNGWYGEFRYGSTVAWEID